MSAWSSGMARETHPESRQDARGALFAGSAPEVARELIALPERFQGRALQRLGDLRTGYFSGRGHLEAGLYRYTDMGGVEETYEDTGLGGKAPDSPDRWYARVVPTQTKQEWLF